MHKIGELASFYTLIPKRSGKLSVVMNSSMRFFPGFSQFFKKNVLFLKIFAKKFGSLNFMRTFAIPNNKSGGGEMVDTLL